MPARDSAVPSPVAAGDPCVPPLLLGYPSDTPAVPLYCHYYPKPETFLPLTAVPGGPPCPTPRLGSLSLCRIPHLGHLCARGPAALSPTPSRTGWRHKRPTPLKNHPQPAQGQYQCPHSPHGDGCQGPAVLNPAVKGGSAARRGHNPGKGAHLPPSQSRPPHHCQPCTSGGCTQPSGVTEQAER